MCLGEFGLILKWFVGSKFDFISSFMVFDFINFWLKFMLNFNTLWEWYFEKENAELNFLHIFQELKPLKHLR